MRRKCICFLLIGLFFLISNFYLGCASLDKTKCKYYSGAPNAPEWICNPSVIEEFITGLGISDKKSEQPDVSTRREIAIMRARQKIAQNIEVKIKNEQKLNELYVNENKKSSFKTILKSITEMCTNITLNDVEEHGNALDPIDGTFYVLLKMNKKKYESLVQLALLDISVSQKTKWENLFYDFSPRQVYEMFFSGNSSLNIIFFSQTNMIDRLSEKLNTIENEINIKEQKIKKSIEFHYQSLINKLESDLFSCHCPEKTELFLILNDLINQFLYCYSSYEKQISMKRINDLNLIIINQCDERSTIIKFISDLLLFQKISEISIGCN